VVFIFDASQSETLNFAMELNFAALVVGAYSPFISPTGMVGYIFFTCKNPNVFLAIWLVGIFGQRVQRGEIGRVQ